MEIDRLVRMANQIAGFFAAYPENEAVAGAANHIRLFWDPRMRRQIAAHIAAGGVGLSPLALAALRAMAESDETAVGNPG